MFSTHDVGKKGPKEPGSGNFSPAKKTGTIPLNIKWPMAHTYVLGLQKPWNIGEI